MVGTPTRARITLVHTDRSSDHVGTLYLVPESHADFGIVLSLDGIDPPEVADHPEILPIMNAVRRSRILTPDAPVIALMDV